MSLLLTVLYKSGFNDRSTKDSQRASNHCNIESLKQMLEKRNCIEILEDSGHVRDKHTNL